MKGSGKRCRRSAMLALAAGATLGTAQAEGSPLDEPSRPPVAAVAVQEAQLLSSMPHPDDHFGASVALSGDTVAVGAFWEQTDRGPYAGAVYVFVREAAVWSLQQRLESPDGAAQDYFGGVAVFGDTLVVGASGHNRINGRGVGAAYVFVRTGTSWTFQQKLVPPDGVSGDAFGGPSIHGDAIVVGAPSLNFAHPGAAYVFTRTGTTWTLQQKLQAQGATGGDWFGATLAVQEDTLVVGAPRSNSDSGAAYAFQRSGGVWAQRHRFLSPDPFLDQFGWSVALDADTVAIGAFSPSDEVAFVATRAGLGWTSLETLTITPEALEDIGFGYSLALYGDTLVVGAFRAPPYQQGAAYVFMRYGSRWIQRQVLTASDTSGADHFGIDVAIQKNTVVAGALRDYRSGAAYVFRIPLPSDYPISYYPLTPCRLVDTRASGFALIANSTRAFTVGGACGVPSDAVAAALIPTAVNPEAGGNLRLYPGGETAPLTSTLNFNAGITRAGNAIIPLDYSGYLAVRCDMLAGRTHFALDVFGYFK